LLRQAAGTADGARSILSNEEIERAARYRFERDAERWICWRAGLRRILAEYLGIDAAEVPIHSPESAKPQLADPDLHLHFNLSHSSNLAAVIVCGDGPVGIDIEPLARAASLPECRHEFCHPAEIEGLPADATSLERALLEIWVAKEALLKALGTGLGFPPRQLRIVGDHGRSSAPLEGLDRFKLATPVMPDRHLLAVAVPLTVQCFETVDD
jgi:phosphopantetheinyl transferase